MENSQKKFLEKELNIVFNDQILSNFKKYCSLFKEYNSHTNLISKNDEKVLFEKHIFDSLSLNLFFKKHKIKNMLDIGTGGGFPSVPAAIAFENISVIALDSIRKKMNFIDLVKTELNLKNLTTVCARAEKSGLNAYFDLVTCRAVSALKNLFPYVSPYVKKDGYFAAFKSKNFEEELKEAQKIIKKYNFELSEIIDYKLPLEENFERKLLIFKKK